MFILKTVTFTKDLLTRVLEFIQMLLRKLKKGVKELFSELEGFLDEVFGLGEKVGDHALTPAEKRVKKKQERVNKKLARKNKQVSLLERGRYLGQQLSLDDLFKIEDYLQKLKVDFQLGEGKGSFNIHGYFTKNGNAVMMEAHNAAMFITDGKNMKLILRENATVYEFLHELMHFRDCQNLGKVAFLEKPLVSREKFVYDKMVEYSKYLNRKELEHAEWHKKIKKGFPFAQYQNDYLQLSEVLLPKYKILFENCPELSELYALKKDRIYFNTSLNIEEKQEILDYVDKNYKIVRHSYGKKNE